MENVNIFMILKSIGILLRPLCYNIAFYIVRPDYIYPLVKNKLFPPKKQAYGQWHGMNIQGNLQGMETKVVDFVRNGNKNDWAFDDSKYFDHINNNRSYDNIPEDVRKMSAEIDWVNYWNETDADQDYLTEILTRNLIGNEDDEAGMDVLIILYTITYKTYMLNAFMLSTFRTIFNL